MVVISDNDDEFGNFLDSQDPVTYNTSTPNGSLIGSSANRDRQPDESIELGNQREADSTKEERLKNLMEERRSKVKPEPGLHEDHIVVRIRHPSLGKFCSFFSVYVCSLCHLK